MLPINWCLSNTHNLNSNSWPVQCTGLARPRPVGQGLPFFNRQHFPHFALHVRLFKATTYLQFLNYSSCGRLLSTCCPPAPLQISERAFGFAQSGSPRLQTMAKCPGGLAPSRAISSTPAPTSLKPIQTCLRPPVSDTSFFFTT